MGVGGSKIKIKSDGASLKRAENELVKLETQIKDLIKKSETALAKNNSNKTKHSSILKHKAIIGKTKEKLNTYIGSTQNKLNRRRNLFNSLASAHQRLKNKNTNIRTNKKSKRNANMLARKQREASEANLRAKKVQQTLG